jgi:hypothetical protein
MNKIYRERDIRKHVMLVWYMHVCTRHGDEQIKNKDANIARAGCYYTHFMCFYFLAQLHLYYFIINRLLIEYYICI